MCFIEDYASGIECYTVIAEQMEYEIRAKILYVCVCGVFGIDTDAKMKIAVGAGFR